MKLSLRHTSTIRSSHLGYICRNRSFFQSYQSPFHFQFDHTLPATRLFHNSFGLSSMDVQIPADESGKLRIVSRTQYQSPSKLAPSTVLLDPMAQFKEWFKAASTPSEDDQSKSVVREPEAMAVSTCSANGIPSTRFVLLKQADSKGFVFYTNYTSRKSNELLANPFASIAFYWREVHRQVRVVGRVERVDAHESDEYFASRPVGSRMGAWASPQSTIVQEEEMARRLAEVEKRFNVSDSAELPRPEFWGGWRVVPQ
jgi:pyridoxamine-phosphate oxidase